MKDTIKKILVTQTKLNFTTETETGKQKLILPCCAVDVLRKLDLLVLTNIELPANEGVCREVKIRGRELQHLYCLKTWDKHVGEWDGDVPQHCAKIRRKKQKLKN